MKRFCVFAFGMYYPQGGMNDFLGSYETEAEAHKAILTAENYEEFDEAHILDIKTELTRKITIRH